MNAVAGGAANVALNVSRHLGSKVESVGWFGKDERGDELIKILIPLMLRWILPFVFPTAPTISKSRITALNHQICRVDRESPVESFIIQELRRSKSF